MCMQTGVMQKGAVHIFPFTSLLAELLGQSVLEQDLSSVCCRGSEKQEETGVKTRRRTGFVLL